MKRIIKVLTFVVFICISSNKSMAVDDGYYFKSMYIEANVKKNAVVDVTEHIQIHYNDSRHGFIKKIPLKYEVKREVDGKVKRFIMHSKIDRINVDGAPYKTEKKEGYRVIKIGDPDEKVIGDKNYIVKYTLDIGDDKVDEYDEFFYSLVGGEWDTYMEDVTFKVTFEKDADLSKFHAYTGKPGSKNEDGVLLEVNGNTVKGSVKNDLGSGEALTVFTRLPKDYFEGARVDTPYLSYAGLLLMSIMLAFSLKNYLSRRNIKRRAIKQIEVRPPDGISSAEVGYIIDESPDDKDIISLIVYFAEKGYLKIEESKNKKFILHKIKDLDKNAPIYQTVFFEALFKSNTYKDTKSDRKRLYDALQVTKTSLKNEFVGERALRDRKLVIKKLVSIIVMVLGMNMLCLSSDLSVMGTVFMGMLLFTTMATSISLFNNMEFKKKSVVVLKAVLIIFLFSLVSLSLVAVSSYPIFLIVGLIIIIINLIVVIKTRDESLYRTEVVSKLLGFKDFIKKADLDRINLLANEDPSYFYLVLPYAYVFGLTDVWIKKFESVNLETPEWYVGNSPVTTYLLCRNLNRCMNNVSKGLDSYASEVQRANSSNFTSSGGGFSGGGAGGGGGSSW